MIFVKLKNPLEKIYQEGLKTTTVTAEYLTSTLENYQLGQTELQFYYKIGKLEFYPNGNPKVFKKIFSGYESIPSEELENWAGDDFVAIEILAEKLELELDEDPNSRVNAPNLHFTS